MGFRFVDIGVSVLNVVGLKGLYDRDSYLFCVLVFVFEIQEKSYPVTLIW